MSAGELLRFVWCVSKLARCSDASLATTTPEGTRFPASSARFAAAARAWSISRSWNVFEPGAAHMSRTRWCGCTSSSKGGIIETASCLVIAPTSLARTRNSRSPRRFSLRFSPSLGTSICHAKPSGYQRRRLGGFISGLSLTMAGNSSSTSLCLVLSRNLPLMFTRNVSGSGARKDAIIASHSS